MSVSVVIFDSLAGAVPCALTENVFVGRLAVSLKSCRVYKKVKSEEVVVQ